jgi:hypothetical protein
MALRLCGVIPHIHMCIYVRVTSWRWNFAGAPGNLVSFREFREALGILGNPENFLRFQEHFLKSLENLPKRMREFREVLSVLPRHCAHFKEMWASAPEIRKLRAKIRASEISTKRSALQYWRLRL